MPLIDHEHPFYWRPQSLASDSLLWEPRGSPNALDQPLCSQMDFSLVGPALSRAVRQLSLSSLSVPPNARGQCAERLDPRAL